MDGHTLYAAAQNGTGPRLLRTLDRGTTWAEVPGLTGFRRAVRTGWRCRTETC